MLRCVLRSSTVSAVFFLTSKTTQQKIVADTLRLWNLESQASPAVPVFNGLILRSKEKICANDVVFCHESRCRYAQDFFRKLEESSAQEALLGEGLITPERVYAAAVEEELCPFELSLELLRRVDVTVCDYNYIYDPAAFDRMEAIDRGRTILIVDEAHNLYSRAREYFSPELALSQIEELRESLRPLTGANKEGESQFTFAWEAASESELCSSIANFPGTAGRIPGADTETLLRSIGVLSRSLRVRTCGGVVGSGMLCRAARRAG